MVLELSLEEVLKVCKECSNFVANNQTCGEESPPKTLTDRKKCPKWDTHYAGHCLFKTHDV